MSDTPAPEQLSLELPKPSCSVCWEDFSQLPELDNHIRASHPERVPEQEELFARREVA